MKTKIAIGAVLALLGITGNANAATVWNVEGHGRLAPGEVVKVAAPGKAKLIVKEPKHLAFRASCTFTTTEALSTTGTTALDETRRASWRCQAAPCGAVTVTASALPWHASLEYPGETPFRLNYEAVALHVTCGGASYGTFTGPIAAVYGDGDPIGDEGERDDDLDNALLWKGAKAGSLTAPGYTMTVGSVQRVGVKHVNGVSAEL
jgi:hypothetical protein